MAITAAKEKVAGTPVTIIRPRRGWWDIDWRSLWEYRELLYFFIWRDVKVRYKQTLIGAAWAIIQPFMTMVVFSLFFGKLAKIPSNGLPYPIFYYSALLPWTYFANSIQNATNTIVTHQNMVKKVYFPRLILPLSATLSGLVDFAIAFSVLLGMMFYYGIIPTWKLLSLPLLLALATITALGVGLWLSALNALYRDVRYATPFLIQIWLFASPIAYPASMVPERWQWVYWLNPMTGVIEGFRWALTGQGQPLNNLFLVSIFIVIFVLAIGLMFFHKMEGTIADVV
ncbi:MAG: ABC transporter permease [Candidatus Bathyarchaeia archaeon]